MLDIQETPLPAREKGKTNRILRMEDVIRAMLSPAIQRRLQYALTLIATELDISIQTAYCGIGRRNFKTGNHPPPEIWFAVRIPTLLVFAEQKRAFQVFAPADATPRGIGYTNINVFASVGAAAISQGETEARHREHDAELLLSIVAMYELQLVTMAKAQEKAGTHHKAIQKILMAIQK